MFTRTLQLRLASLIFLFGWGAITSLEAQTSDVLTNVSQLTEAINANVRTVLSVRLNGAIYGVDRTHNGLALRDNSGLLWMRAENLPEALSPGMIVTLQGHVTAGKGHAFLGKAPIIEGEYYSDSSAQSGRVYLTAGKHSLEFLYHQGSRKAVLDVSYEGPGITNQEIPASAFSHVDTNSPSGFAPGLNYVCYRGYTTEYPDLQNLKPDISGVSETLFGSFRTSGANKNTGTTEKKASGPNVNYVLRFTGCLQIDRAGVYQFNVTADDGARMTLDFGDQCQIEIIGRTEPANPQTLLPSQLWGDLHEPLWAETEGIVKEIGEFEGKLQIGLVGDTGLMKITIADGNIDASAMLLNSRIRVTGLAYGTTTFHDKKVAGRMLVPSMDEVALVKVSEACWQTYPSGRINDLTRDSKTNLDQTPIHVRGKIVNVVPGDHFTLQDETGKIMVRNRRVRAEHLDASVDVLGLAEHMGTQAILRYAVFRPQSATNDFLPVLTSIEQIRQLKESDATSNCPVKLKGVVIRVASDGLRGNVRGESDGIQIVTYSPQPSVLKIGDVCEFEGQVKWDRGIPVIDYSSFNVLGHGQMPEPLHPTRNELMNGSVDGQWVEVQGVVLSVLPSGSQMTVGLPGGEMRMHLARDNRDTWDRLVDAVVRVRGVAVTYFNKNHEPNGGAIEIDSPLDITVVTPSPKNLFSLPVKRIDELLTFDPNAATFPYVKIKGQIVFGHDSTFYLMNGSSGLRFVTRDDAKLEPGDLVEVVGIPENDRLARHLKSCYAKKNGHAALPQPAPVTAGRLNVDRYESTLIELETTLLSVSTNVDEEVLELQMTSTRVLSAHLPKRCGSFPKLQPESLVRVTGVFTSTSRTDDTSPEILMNSPADLVVLKTPPWWNLRRSLAALTAMGIVLLLAVSWIRTLRKRVERRTSQLRAEIAEHQRTESQLNEKTVLLLNEIEERKRMQIEVEQIHRRLVDASRHAGQAEIAVNVLHNVGNVLNSVNVSTSVVTERVRKLRPASITKAVNLMEESAPNPFTADEKGQQLLNFFKQLGVHWTKEQENLLKELHSLGQNVEHIKEIVATQQSYARRFGIFEKITVSELVNDALKVLAAAFARDSIKVVKEFENMPAATVDKHQVLQILVNFLQNAKRACDEGHSLEKAIIVRIRQRPPDRVVIEVSDNGIGIAPENISRIFTHGFTTRKDGHGFGLHSAALAAKEMGGTLAFHSDGLDHGATFTLELPLQPKTQEPVEEAMETPVTVS